MRMIVDLSQGGRWGRRGWRSRDIELDYLWRRLHLQLRQQHGVGGRAGAVQRRGDLLQGRQEDCFPSKSDWKEWNGRLWHPLPHNQPQRWVPDGAHWLDPGVLRKYNLLVQTAARIFPLNQSFLKVKLTRNCKNNCLLVLDRNNKKIIIFILILDPFYYELIIIFMFGVLLWKIV